MMFKSVVFLLMIVFGSCNYKVDSPSDEFLLKYCDDCSGLIVIYWDQCSSCQTSYVDLIEDYVKREDVVILLVSNIERKVSYLLSGDNIKFAPSEEIIKLNLYSSVPVIYSFYQGKIIDREQVDISIY